MLILDRDVKQTANEVLNAMIEDTWRWQSENPNGF